MVLRSALLIVVAAVAVREHRGWLWVGLGVLALGAYGFVATLQPDAQFGRVLAAYGGVFIAGSLACGAVFDTPGGGSPEGLRPGVASPPRHWGTPRPLLNGGPELVAIRDDVIKTRHARDDPTDPFAAWRG